LEHTYQAGARYFNTEDGYQVFCKNNYGLPGLDLTSRGKANVVVWGNSFVEGRASRPELLATSILMSALQARHPDTFQVINLGTGGQPPYYGLYKIRYWSRLFPPDYVILVLEDSMLREAVKAADSVFTLSPDFGKPATGSGKTLVVSLCAVSSFANVINFGIAYASDARKTALAEKPSQHSKKPAAAPTDAYHKIEADYFVNDFKKTLLKKIKLLPYVKWSEIFRKK
jgi:hypothetical protein